MAVNLTRQARNASTQSVIEPNLIVEIEGINGDNGLPLLFGISDVQTIPIFDDDPVRLFDDGLFFDTPVADRNSRAYLDFKGTTKNLKQQLLVDKGGAGTVSNMKVRLINKDNELTELFSTGIRIKDIFGALAKIFIGFQGTSHPENSSEIFRGIINDISSEHGGFTLTIAHPDQFKRQNLFEVITDKLTADLNNSDATVFIEDATRFTGSVSNVGFFAYARVNDELMRIEDPGMTDLAVTRGQLGSSAVSHEEGDTVESFYRLVGQPIEVTLRILMSDPDNQYYSVTEPDGFAIFGAEVDQNGIFYADPRFSDNNIIPGDIVLIENSINLGFRNVISVDPFEGGFKVVVDGLPFSIEGTGATVSYASQFNVYPIGLAINPRFIDLEGILEVRDEIDLGLPEIDIYIEDQIDSMKEWLEKEIFKPCGLYSLNRKGKISLKFTRPAIANEEIKVISPETITDASITRLKLKRSFGKNFYNQVTYRFERNPIRDKYEANTFIVSSDSLNRINLGKKQLLNEANGFRDNGATRQAIARIGSRILSRYQFGARYIDGVEVLFRTGYPIEIGDVVLARDLKLPDLEANTATFGPKLMEVVNKELDIQSGKIKLNLLETSFSLDARYGTISPASKIVSQSSSNSVIIQRSFGVSDIVERSKYELFIGGKFVIRSADFTQAQVVTLSDFNLSNENELTFDETITVPVDNTYIFEFADYNQCNDLQKTLHTFIAPNEEVTSGASETVFDSSNTNLFVGAQIQITRSDFTAWSNEATILDITGTTITVDNELGFIPTAGDIVGIIGFSDEGNAYRFV